MTRAALRTGASVVLTWLALAGWAAAQPPTRPSPVSAAHLAQINRLFASTGIAGAWVVLDRQGRAELQGQFENERQVDLAFSLAQSVVGVRWVSAITPQQIKVKEWEECFSRLLSGDTCARPGAPAPVVPAADGVAPGPVSRKYALIVGVGRFKHRIQPLQYANKDAFDLYTYLVDPALGNFPRDDVILLRDEHATRDAVVRALDEIRRRAREDDLVLLYFSSHGTPPDKFGAVHVVTHESEVTPRERIWETSLTENILRDFVQQVRAKRLLVIVDACYSNGAYRQIAGFLPPGGKSLEAGWDEGYGRSRRHMAQRLLGAKDLVLDLTPAGLPGAAPREPPTGWGKVLISASDAGERSWESDQLRNSIFTRYLIEGLRTHGGAVREAFDDARPLVREHVKREKGGDVEQNPQLTPNRRDWNMSVAASGR